VTPGVLLVANRGEVAVRVLRTARERHWGTVAVAGPDDLGALHTRLADRTFTLPGRGSAAYLDAAAIVAAATAGQATALHPGWGFLSEDPAFARACIEAGLRWVGPSPEVLELFGDKVAARRFARAQGVPVAAATEGPTSLDEANDFWAGLGPGAAVMVKAISGGGGRGIRTVRRGDDLAQALTQCRAEALLSSGRGDVYVEAHMPDARHLEVQLIGDGAGSVTHLGTRDCSVQRRHQKLVEIAPAGHLDSTQVDALTSAAVRVGRAARLAGVATVEFLVGPDGGFVFMEVNPRLQVEHTVTEAVTGLDLVALQLGLAAGASLRDLGLDPDDPPAVRGVAVQARVNAERVLGDGSVTATAGTIRALAIPGGPGVRVDTHAYAGYTTNPSFDSLLAKVVAWSPTTELAAAADRADRALADLAIDGVEVNVGLLRAILAADEFRTGRATTGFLGANLAALLEARPADVALPGPTPDPQAGTPPDAGRGTPGVALGPGQFVVEAPMPATVVSVGVSVGDRVRPGDALVVVESMKMEHLIEAAAAGEVDEVLVGPGDTVTTGQVLVVLTRADVEAAATVAAAAWDLDHHRPDLAEVRQRQGLTRDEARPAAVARRRRTGQRTARENLDDLCDPGTFVEYGSLAIAAQRARRHFDDLVLNTPADGLIGGLAHINGRHFGDDRSRCAVVSYDYTVLAGTQGQQGHRKKDRLFELAKRLRLPLVLFAEGGGGRPGDTEGVGISGLDCLAFALFAELSGLVPLVGIVSGRCFAGNAALLGCCDVIIATANSSIGMAGPAMIEGGGLGHFTPEEVGPMSVQVPNGVVDIAVEDEAAAVATAKQYLSYFQGRVSDWDSPDQRTLRTLIPENRVRVYDIRLIIATLADTGSVLELRAGWAPGMVTAFIRVEGRPLGLVANNPRHLGGAIDADGADKAARFMQLCDAHDIPLLFLCDTPGFMVGPEAERTAQVRHFARMFVTEASLDIPYFTIVLRKGYGLGAQAMAGGGFHSPLFCLSWPTGEFGGMGLEGAIELGYRRELDAIDDPVARQARYDALVANLYEKGKALSTATYFEIDDVIDPAESRARIVATLRACPPARARTGKKRPCVDTW
jgi:acetyl/propionyl-CoA carboxylase alpha subunit/acetyl-CoA carboxylase carboxyltransferase component